MPKVAVQVVEEKKAPLRRTITRKTLAHKDIKKRQLFTAMKSLMKANPPLLPEIAGMNHMEKSELIHAAPTWALARIWMEIENQKQKQADIFADFSDEQKQILAELKTHTAEAIKAALKELEIKIKHKNALTREELIFEVVASGNGPAVLTNVTKVETEESMDTDDIVLECEEADEESTEEAAVPVEEEVVPVVVPVAPARIQNNKQPSTQAIKQAMRLAGCVKLPSKRAATKIVAKP